MLHQNQLLQAFCNAFSCYRQQIALLRLVQVVKNETAVL
jgi:hypothetical protein